MMKRLWLLLLAAMLLPPGGAAAAERGPEHKLETLEGLVGGFYLASVEGNRQLAYSYVTKIKRLSASPELRAFGEPAGWERIDDSLDLAEKALRKGDSASAWREEASRLKLAVDALAPGRRSLWLQYELLLREDINRLKKAWSRGGPEGAEAASAALIQLKEHVDRMEAAASVGQPPERIRLLQERIRYAGTLIEAAKRDEANPKWVEGSFVLIADAADRVFETPGKPADAPVAGEPPASWMLMMASIVLSALTYAGWRKFRHDRSGITSLKRPVG